MKAKINPKSPRTILPKHFQMLTLVMHLFFCFSVSKEQLIMQSNHLTEFYELIDHDSLCLNFRASKHVANVQRLVAHHIFNFPLRFLVTES